MKQDQLIVITSTGDPGKILAWTPEIWVLFPASQAQMEVSTTKQ